MAYRASESTTCHLCRRGGIMNSTFAVSASFTATNRFSTHIRNALFLNTTNTFASYNQSRAQEKFDQLHLPDVQSCTNMIIRYARENKLEAALRIFKQMPYRDTVSWNSMIKACLDCGDLCSARNMFDEMPQRSIISWTTMIHGFFRFGRDEMAGKLFCTMPKKDLASYNAMVHGYCSNGRVEEGLRFFEGMPSRDVISWTSMIGGLDQIGKSKEALSLFKRMMQSGGVAPSSSTWATVLTACANSSSSFLGRQTHSHVIRIGFSRDDFVCASLITFYAHCNDIVKAVKVFDPMHENVVVWTALISGFGLNQKHEDALIVFGNMLRRSVIPNQSSFVSALNSCCSLEALDQGREIHALAMKLINVGTDTFVGNSLIVTYSKCGSLEDALIIFRRMRRKNGVTWNAAMSGCSHYGRSAWCLEIFNRMIRADVELDDFTLTALLSACSHSRLPGKGRRLFLFFKTNTSVELKHEHYASMVDILGRCSDLKEAEDLVRNMPMEPNSIVWLALLSAAKLCLDLDVAERTTNKILDLDPTCSAAYVLMSNLYASLDRWSDVWRLRAVMKNRGIIKQRGSSWVVLKGVKHSFLSGDTSHPLSNQIYEKLDWLRGKLIESGYIPDLGFSLHDIEDEDSVEFLGYHSERLAVAFGLLSTLEGSTIIVMKNLRVCVDCHSILKLVAKIVGRVIVVRDCNRFHQFRNGRCSCGDHW